MLSQNKRRIRSRIITSRPATAVSESLRSYRLWTRCDSVPHSQHTAGSSELQASMNNTGPDVHTRSISR
jgi:hypothetical protein